MAERSKAAVLKTVIPDEGIGGSNPPLSSIYFLKINSKPQKK